MSVICYEKEYASFGKCVFLENDFVTLGVYVEAGSRIIYYGLKDRENVLFEDDKRRFTEQVEGFGAWYYYGGHRCWAAPELMPETYYPDNSPVEYTFENDVLTLRPPVTRFGKQITITIGLDDNSPAVTVTNTVANLSDKPAVFAPWSITGLRAGGVCRVPITTRKSGFLPNRVLCLWDYSDINDDRFKLGNSEATIIQDPNAEKAFKAGFNVEDGFLAYSVAGQVFVKSVEAYRDVKYPDYSCNAEVYTNSGFLECEVLGEQREYAAGESASVTERWYLLDNSDDTLSDIGAIRSAVGAAGVV